MLPQVLHRKRWHQLGACARWSDRPWEPWRRGVAQPGWEGKPPAQLYEQEGGGLVEAFVTPQHEHKDGSVRAFQGCSPDS